MTKKAVKPLQRKRGRRKKTHNLGKGEGSLDLEVDSKKKEVAYIDLSGRSRRTDVGGEGPFPKG